MVFKMYTAGAGFYGTNPVIHDKTVSSNNSTVENNNQTDRQLSVKYPV